MNEQISIAVQQTIAAIPTFTPYPSPVVVATSTPASLAGLFCEYQFCIGHPADMAFYDATAKGDPSLSTLSTASQGNLVAYNAKLFIQFLWQDAPGSSDPQFMLNRIVIPKVDTRSGNLNPLLIGNLNVIYTPITTTATPILPDGGAAAWICGGRAFAWKAYTPQPDIPKNLLIEALQSFRCYE